MNNADAAYAGSIPGIYNRHLGPLLFQPFADLLSRRVAAWQPRRLLETAAGTGLLTAKLADTCPKADIAASDLNADMLSVAAQRIGSARVQTRVADAQDLPFPDDAFDVVVCQFGAMFYPDKVRASREAQRVLRHGGRYLLAIWDSISNNSAANAVHRAVAELFPNDPPNFLARAPYGYSDPKLIERDLVTAGFRSVQVETVKLTSEPEASIEDAAIGLVHGCPLKAEIEERDSSLLNRAEEAALAALRTLVDGEHFRSHLSAHIVTAVK